MPKVHGSSMRRLCLFFALLLPGCALLPGASAPPPQPAVRADPLKPGDDVRIAVAGERELSGIFAVAANGMVHLELLGDVMAAGLTPAMLAADLRQRLAAGYLKQPEVTVVRAAPPPSLPPPPPPALTGSLAGTAPSPPPVLRRSQDVAPPL